MRNSFLRNTAESIVQAIGWDKLSGVTLVLPSHRAGLVLTEEILNLQAEQNIKALWSPSVLTLTQLQDALSPLYAEDELKTIVRLYRHYRWQNEGDEDLMPLEMFYGWGKQMLSDFTNVDASMPAEQVPNFFDNTIAAHELSQWRIDEEVLSRLRALFRDEDKPVKEESIRRQYEQIWRRLYELYKLLREELSAEQKGYSGMRQRAVIEHWNDASVQDQIRGRMYIFAGFNYLLPVERELMQRLKDAGQALFFWDYVPDFTTNEKAFSFARLNAGILGGAQKTENRNQTDFPKEVTILSCSSREAQAQYVHRWLLENYTEKGQKAGIVICDESMLEPVIYALPTVILPGQTEPEPINITKGFPLRNTHIYARTLEWLYDKSRGDIEQVVSPGFIDDLLNYLFPESPDTEEEPEAEDTTDALSWQELLILESGYQVRVVANQMRQLIAEGLGDVPVTLSLLRLLMRRVMEGISMPFHGEPVTDIQVMGVLETRMLDFDKLLLLNVEEGVLPQTQADNSFIPYYLRKSYSMQTSDERATVYAYNFFRLLSRARHSTLLFTSADAGKNSKGMSRFIMQMLVSPEFFTVTKGQLQESNDLMPADELVMTSEVAYKDIGRLSLSPSALNTYISCPLKFYYQHVLDKHQEDEEETIFKSHTMGTFVHEAMEHLYEKYLHAQKENNPPLPVSPDEIGHILADSSILEEALAYAYKRVNAEWEKRHDGEKDHYKPEEHQHEKPILLTYIRRILERDRKDAEVGLKICLLEANRYFPVSVEGVGEVRIGGRIDRLDIYGPEGNERLRIVDYKTGTYNSSDTSATMATIMTDKKKGYVRQTLIYSHAVMPSDLPVEPNLFYCSRELKDATTTLSVDKSPVTDYRQLSDEFMKALAPKIAEVMITTTFPACEEKDCSPFCPFLGICKRKPYKTEE